MTYPPQPEPLQPTPTPPPDVPYGPLTPTRRKRKPLLWVASGVAVALLLCCGIGTIANLATDEPNKPASSAATSSASPSSSARASSNTPSVAPSTSSAPPPTSAPPPAAPKPKVYSGRGDDVIKVGDLTDLSVVKFSCPRCSSNTVLKSDGPEGLLVNEIGAYTGKRWINLEEYSLTTQFEVETRGEWTLTIGSVEQLATKAPSGKASGRGDDVILLGGSASTARIKHSKGQSNFVVEAYSLDTGMGGLLINEIGGYSGTRPLEAPALVQVTADGLWSINPV
ncbi:hypothetical protein AB0M35_27855 [Micromonospora sp. NPDC051196]|uniref:hypothetical protein n=1 Tax=Micromonospora sp. NPDC051196 TaxID=3155281 RepID=UPI003434F203